jgi:tetratricopeptide (TPR) repeat protein
VDQWAQFAENWRKALDEHGLTYFHFLEFNSRHECHAAIHIEFLLNLAELHYFEGAYADAEKEAAFALALLRRTPSPNPDHRLEALSLTHAKTDRHARAAAFLREALTLLNYLTQLANACHCRRPALTRRDARLLGGVSERPGSPCEVVRPDSLALGHYQLIKPSV